MSFDLYKIAWRVCDGHGPERYPTCYRSAERLAELCESPIELMLAAAFELTNELASLKVYIGPKSDQLPAAHLHVLPQVQINAYRVDFMVLYEDQVVLIECDGHDFHERTADQAERDRRRDRELQGTGFSILRFTGREIYRSPTDCVRQVLDFISATRQKVA